MSHKERLRQIDDELEKLNNQRHALIEERDRLEMEDDRAHYNCRCVRLNKDLNIHDMIAQENAGRKGLQFGLVGETLSAVKKCPSCHGKGVPEKEL